MTDETFKNLALLRHTNKIASKVTTDIINEKSHEAGIEQQLKEKRKEQSDLRAKIKDGSATKQDKVHYSELMNEIAELNKQKKEICELEYQYKRDCEKVVRDTESTEINLLGLNKETVREKTVSEINNLRSARGVDSTKGV